MSDTPSIDYKGREQVDDDDAINQPDVFSEGVEAFKDELGRNRNPYPARTYKANRWDDGWTWMREQ